MSTPSSDPGRGRRRGAWFILAIALALAMPLVVAVISPGPTPGAGGGAPAAEGSSSVALAPHWPTSRLTAQLPGPPRGRTAPTGSASAPHVSGSGRPSAGRTSGGALFTRSGALPEAAPVGESGAGGHARQAGISLTPSNTQPHWACPEGPCEAIVDPPPVRRRGHWALPAGGPLLEGGGEGGGFDPQDLQSAYGIPATGGSTQTVALVEAYGYAAAETDLASYRERYGLSACTKANGCFRKVNEEGVESGYPATESSEWITESALDLDMVSAACPECHIVLVEASSQSVLDLGHAANTAASLGATEISNSYGVPEEACGGTSDCQEYATDYDHPGVLVTASAGDSGYDNYFGGYASPSFPAASPYVLAVGGTSLRKASGSRGWSEAAWLETGRRLGSGGGCSLSEPKPVWQADGGCAHRTDNDVAAVAACETPVSVYSAGNGGWGDYCGTSVSAPLLAAIGAHGSAYARSLPGADAYYHDPGGLFDVTAGSDGECAPAEVEYLCHAEIGYDGPTGEGTPDGPITITAAAPSVATHSASAVAGGSARLNGAVNPSALATSYHFEYGTSTAYGTSVPASGASAGSGTGTSEVSQTISGLQANTTYHFRLVATNSAGASDGQDTSFSTAPPSVSGVSPNSGPAAASNSVTVSGNHFAGATAVNFGSVAVHRIDVESEGRIAVSAPAGTGIVNVTVTTPAGTSETSAADQYRYLLGSVFGFGLNASGQLGIGNTVTAVTTPEEVSNLSEAVSLAGGDSSLALLSNGTVMSWGENFYGELGDGTFALSDVPQKVCAVAVSSCPGGPYLHEVTAVAAGVADSIALLKNGTVVGWGSDYEGQLPGAGANDTDVPVHLCAVSEAPCKPENYLKEVVAIAAGGWDNLALLKNGTVLAWGYNESAELGDGHVSGPELCDENFYQCSRTPAPVLGLSEVAAIAAGTNHNLALLQNGTVMAWGENGSGELGDGNASGPQTCTERKGTYACSSTPVAVAGLSEASAIAGGWGYSVALLRNGKVMTWGNNCEGELGIGVGCGGPEYCPEQRPCSVKPVLVSSLSEVRAIAAGETDSGTLALLQNGSVMGWGGDMYGELGNGERLQSNSPVASCAPYETAPCASHLTGITAVFAGGDHSFAIRAQPPSVSNLSAHAGPVGGGTPVTITGTNFTGASEVKFGSVKATSFEVLSPTQISTVAPAFAGGNAIAEVTVTTPQGTSALSIGDSFIYQPTVSQIEPTGGPAGGGTTVIIHGSAYQGHYLNGAQETPSFVAAVRFGAASATNVEVLSGEEIKATAPHGNGTVDVTVESAGGASAAAPGDQFTYTAQAGSLEFPHWTLAGSLRPRGLAQAITLPAGAFFEGDGELDEQTGVGTIAGSISVPPFTAPLMLFGALPVKLAMTLSAAGPLEGSLTASEPPAGGEALSLPLELDMDISSVTILGLELPAGCSPTQPLALNLAANLTREELTSGGWRFAGSTTLSRFRCEQGFLGPVLAILLTSVLSGPANPYSITISPPAP